MLRKRIPVLLFILLFIAGCSQNNSNTDDITFRHMDVSIDYQGAYINSYNRNKVFYAFEAAGCSLFPFYAAIPEDTISTDTVDINYNWDNLRYWANENMHNTDTMYVHLIYIKCIKNPPPPSGYYSGITFYDLGATPTGHEWGGGPNSISLVLVASIDSFLRTKPPLISKLKEIVDVTTIHELGHQWANLAHCDTLHDCAMLQGIWMHYNAYEMKWYLDEHNWLNGFCDTCNQKIKNDNW
jgi:hypothetical protein